MTRIIQKSDGRGSLKDIQVLVNKNQDLIDNLIKSSFNELANQQIIWTSPIEQDDFAEYRDNDFLVKVGLDPTEIKLDDFWPAKGPQWDALAKTTGGHVILVEAKANIPEIVSPGTSASKNSRTIIDKSLKETKTFLNLTNDIDWSGKYYQYTNRLAHLFFLRVKCNKPTFLVNVYFIGDDTVSGPKTKQEWEAALKVLHTYLGLTRHRLSEYMTDIFIDVKDLKQ
ncbi:hypothetical protein U5907_07955 [Bacteroidales bacterium MB20-C3-3]|jgi:hypothetical protein|nr:hypothetical protein U5907_07955 [Bacteroidales bacterium MB20-C3-3]